MKIQEAAEEQAKAQAQARARKEAEEKANLKKEADASEAKKSAAGLTALLEALEVEAKAKKELDGREKEVDLEKMARQDLEPDLKRYLKNELHLSLPA